MDRFTTEFHLDKLMKFAWTVKSTTAPHDPELTLRCLARVEAELMSGLADLGLQLHRIDFRAAAKAQPGDSVSAARAGAGGRLPRLPALYPPNT